MAGLLLWTKKCFEFEFVGVQRAFLSERKGKVMPCTGSEDKKKHGNREWNRGARDLEAESIGSRAESTCGCVHLETLTDTHFVV